MAKSPSSKVKLADFLERQEKSLRNAFRNFVRAAKSKEIIDEVAALIGAGRSNEAIAIITGQAQVMAPATNKIFSDSMTFEAKNLINAEIRALRPTFTASIDVYSPEAARVAAQMTTDLIVDITDKQALVIRQFILSGYGNRLSKDQVARQIRSIIGLTRKQTEMVENYEALLRRGSRAALRRVIRDQRYDGAIERAINAGKPLTEDQIRRMVESYRRMRIAYRAKLIAHNETSGIVSAAQDVAARQIVDRLGLPLSSIEGTWETKDDGRERDSHEPMNGQKRRMTEQFVTGAGVLIWRPHDPQAPASETDGCRCRRHLKIILN